MKLTGNAETAWCSVEYGLVHQFYQDGNERANRSKVLKINHIVEGLIILESIGASVRTMKAFCLHAAMQSDDDMRRYIAMTDHLPVDVGAVALAVEYRNIANSFLCTPDTDHITVSDLPEIKIYEVVEMLIADKIQNRKDFITYHQGTHDRSDALTNYFQVWLEFLGVTTVAYNNACRLIDSHYPSETEYLNSSPKNAARLQESIEQLK